MRTGSTALVTLLCAVLAMPAWADNDKNKGNNNGKAQKSDNRGDDKKGDNDNRGNNDRGNNDRGDSDRSNRNAGPGSVAVPYQQVVVVDRDRNLVHTYYRNEYAAGRCPPGLAKKNNGCLPPGQAKRTWIIGQPLPPQLVYYPMPRELWTQLTPPPNGYEYVRVDNDIVLMSTASRVIAALLGSLDGLN